jgi:signal transduction histidine kinase
METKFEDTNVPELVEGAVSDVRLWAQTNEIELATEVKADRWRLDPALIRRTLVNLLSNAIKFSKPGDRILITAESSSGVIRFSVADQGPGIPEEYREKIFEPFGQVKGTKTGTGLGLTFCRLAVQAHHGRIWVESVLGHGTTMIFTMPELARPTSSSEST